MPKLLTFHLFCTLALLVLALFRMRSGVTVLNSFIVVFAACSCLGLNLAYYAPSLLIVENISDLAFTRAAQANLIFHLLSFAALLLQARVDSGKSGSHCLPSGVPTQALVIVMTILASIYVVWWLSWNNLWGAAFEAYTQTNTSGQYYQYRRLVEEELIAVAGRGTWTAKRVILNVAPFVILWLGYLFYRTHNPIFFIFILVLSGVSFIAASALAHKTYLLVAVFAPFYGLLAWQMHHRFRWVVATVLGSVLLACATFIFQAAGDFDREEALEKLLVRVFVTPATIPLIYYDYIPEGLPFRGWRAGLYMAHVFAPPWDYAVYDVAYAATGRYFGANANFLAVGYSGAGLLGVCFVSAICLGMVFLLDLLLMSLEVTHRLVAVFASVPGFVAINSIHLLGAIENGFLLAPFAFLLCCRGRVQEQNIAVALPSGRLVVQV